MSNPYFRFKQFVVRQDRCAMKVSTDACIQGAWTPVDASVLRVLDIGAGTGLLSLMLAQRIPGAHIDALELDADAAAQAAENVAASPFAARVRVFNNDAVDWETSKPYDLIISNPPFFSKALLGPDASRNSARHAGSLDADALIELTLRNLVPEGSASFLWPPPEHESFCRKAAGRLFLKESLRICHREGGKVTRVVSIWSRQPAGDTIEESLIIKGAKDAYTTKFSRLLSPFYLAL